MAVFGQSLLLSAFSYVQQYYFLVSIITKIGKLIAEQASEKSGFSPNFFQLFSRKSTKDLVDFLITHITLVILGMGVNRRIFSCFCSPVEHSAHVVI